MTNFSLKVKKLREKFGLTQEEFAQKLGTCRSCIFLWEKGKSIPIRNMQRTIDALCKKHKIEE